MGMYQLNQLITSILLYFNFTLHKFESNSSELEQMINRMVHELSITKTLVYDGIKSMIQL